MVGLSMTLKKEVLKEDQEEVGLEEVEDAEEEGMIQRNKKIEIMKRVAAVKDLL